MAKKAKHCCLMVRLKVFCSVEDIDEVADFNSVMVRLKVTFEEIPEGYTIRTW